MLTANARRILWCLRSQFISTGRNPKNLTAATTVDNSILCLNGRNLILCLHGLISTDTFQNPQILRTNSSGHDIIHTPTPFPAWGFIMTRVIQYTNPSALAGYDTRSIFKRSLTGLNSEFSFSLTSCLTKAEEPSLSYYLPIAGGRIIGFIPFPRVLVQCEMQSTSSRVWTRVAVSISYDDNHYTTGISILTPPYDNSDCHILYVRA